MYFATLKRIKSFKAIRALFGNKKNEQNLSMCSKNLHDKA